MYISEIFNENAFNCFKQALFETSWDSVENIKQPNEAYNKVFTGLYDIFFCKKNQNKTLKSSKPLDYQ